MTEIRCLILLSIAAAAPLNSSGPNTDNTDKSESARSKNMLKNIFHDLKTLKSDFLNIFNPSNIISPTNIKKIKPSNTSPSVQFSQTQFVSVTTEAPKQKKENSDDLSDLTGTRLYREDVVRKSWHFKKSRTLTIEKNSIDY